MGGCAAPRTVETLSLALAVGLDPGDDSDMIVTLAVPLFEKDAPEKEIILSGKGKSFLEAVQRITEQKDKDVQLGQVRVIVLGEEFLKRSMFEKSLDPLSRESDFPLNCYMVAAKGTAKELLDIKLPANPRVGNYIYTMIESGELSAIINAQDLNDFYVRLNAEGWDPSLPFMEKGVKTLNLVGTALFQDDKMIDSIDINETQTMLILMEEAVNSLIIFSDPFVPSKNVVLQVRKNSCKVKTRIVDGRPEIDLHVKLRVDLVNKSQFVSLLEQKNIEKYEQSLAAQFNNRAERLLEKLQILRTDPIGLGAYLRAQNYAYWKQIGDQGWRELLPVVKINVTTEVDLRSFGVIIK